MIYSKAEVVRNGISMQNSSNRIAVISRPIVSHSVVSPLLMTFGLNIFAEVV